MKNIKEQPDSVKKSVPIKIFTDKELSGMYITRGKIVTSKSQRFTNIIKAIPLSISVAKKISSRKHLTKCENLRLYLKVFNRKLKSGLNN